MRSPPPDLYMENLAQLPGVVQGKAYRFKQGKVECEWLGRRRSWKFICIAGRWNWLRAIGTISGPNYIPYPWLVLFFNCGDNIIPSGQGMKIAFSESIKYFLAQNL